MSSQFGVIGTAVMGRNLALNILDHDFSVAAWNLEQDLLDRAVAESAGRLTATESLAALVAQLEKPRRILMMIKAGKPVDIVLEQLVPMLEDGDIVIDGGNSLFTDTQRREKAWSGDGVHFVGMGVSGGEEGARNGPSLMPGGSKHAYGHIAPVLESIAAVSDSGPCVTHCGPDGAGHFVKIVHNGIEYADMQAIAEAYDLLHRVGGLDNNALADTFSSWNAGPLESFLIEITAKIFAKQEDGHFLVDDVLDKADQKGTGRWTAQIALDLGVSTPSIAAAIDARVLSNLKEERLRAAGLYAEPASKAAPDNFVAVVHDALFAAKIAAYAQGMDLIHRGSVANDWGIQCQEIARIWKAGCIIRARFLNTIMQAYSAQPGCANLMFHDVVRAELEPRIPALRQAVAVAAEAGVPTFAMNASLAYFDSMRTGRLPQNLTQAQRDAFGAHTYQRISAPDAGPIHSEWLDE
ncbi:MAG: NADP-dependent phosphogluconate dehydrogenase [Pseudomonadota bacterium]